MRPMNWKWFVLAWGFVFGVAAYDTCFAWQHRASFSQWELNPAACWANEQFGLSAVFIYKFAALFLAVSVASYCQMRGRRSGSAMTLLLAAAHGVLVVMYVTSAHDPLDLDANAALSSIGTAF